MIWKPLLASSLLYRINLTVMKIQPGPLGQTGFQFSAWTREAEIGGTIRSPLRTVFYTPKKKMIFFLLFSFSNSVPFNRGEPTKLERKLERGREAYLALDFLLSFYFFIPSREDQGRRYMSIYPVLWENKWVAPVIMKLSYAPWLNLFYNAFMLDPPKPLVAERRTRTRVESYRGTRRTEMLKGCNVNLTSYVNGGSFGSIR